METLELLELQEKKWDGKSRMYVNTLIGKVQDEFWCSGCNYYIADDGEITIVSGWGRYESISPAELQQKIVEANDQMDEIIVARNKHIDEALRVARKRYGDHVTLRCAWTRGAVRWTIEDARVARTHEPFNMFDLDGVSNDTAGTMKTISIAWAYENAHWDWHFCSWLKLN